MWMELEQTRFEKAKEKSLLDYASGMPPRILSRVDKTKLTPEYEELTTAERVGRNSSLKGRVLCRRKVRKLQCVAASVCYSHHVAASNSSTVCSVA